MNVETTEAWDITPKIAPGADEAEWSPDGKYLYFRDAQSRTETMTWQGVTYDAVTKLLDARGRK
jgi:hypothetical protein